MVDVDPVRWSVPPERLAVAVAAVTPPPDPVTRPPQEVVLLVLSGAVVAVRVQQTYALVVRALSYER